MPVCCRPSARGRLRSPPLTACKRPQQKHRSMGDGQHHPIARTRCCWREPGGLCKERGKVGGLCMRSGLRACLQHLELPASCQQAQHIACSDRLRGQPNAPLHGLFLLWAVIVAAANSPIVWSVGANRPRGSAVEAGSNSALTAVGHGTHIDT